MAGKRKTIEYTVTGLGCHECTSHHINVHGYPCIWNGGRNQNMHRVLYEEEYGIIPKGLLVRHKCDNRLCINLNHLELGTPTENSQDCKNRGRLNTPRGEDRSDTKLTDSEVREIKDSIGVSQSKLAKTYGVNQSTISRIQNNKRRSYG